VLRRLCFALLWLTFVWPTSTIADAELLRVRTRFGTVFVVRSSDDCCMGYIRFRSEKIEVPSTGTVYAELKGVYRVPEGDVIVLSAPSGVRGMPPHPYVLVVNDKEIADITDHERMEPGEDTFRIVQKGNEIHFDLGFENRLRKKAVYRNGVLYIGVDRFHIERTLPKPACADVLRMLAGCKRTSDCPKEGVVQDWSMAMERAFTTYERMPVFDPDNYYKACARVCARKTRPVEERKLLCGY
jgi:hypothetical protein